MKFVKTLISVGTLTLVFFIFSTQISAQMTSTNFRIDWDNLGFIGDDTSSSTSYELRSSGGETAQGQSSSATYITDSGYRGGVYDRTATFNTYVQDLSSQVGATVISSNTITVTTVAGFAVNEFIAIVQDEGASQVVAIGKILSIATPDLTVDFLTGASLTIDGTNDFVYSLDSGTIDFGILSASVVSTAIMAWEVNADVGDGYGVYIYEDDNLKSGENIIPDVADATVTSGVSEYGARANDSTLAGSNFDTQDEAISSTLALIGSETDNSFKSRNFITLKLAVTDTQADGSYAHNLNLIYVGDY